jgi:16S rRNA processing protein RimM
VTVPARSRQGGEAVFGKFRVAATQSEAQVDVNADGSTPPASVVGQAPEAPQARVSPAAAWPDELIEVGTVIEAYGVRGWIKIRPHAQVGAGGDVMLAARQWWLSRGEGDRVERRVGKVIQSRGHSGSVVALLADCSERNAAEALKGFRIHVRRADFPAIEGEDEFYWVDLIGLSVVNLNGDVLGTVRDLIDNGAHSILRVQYGVEGSVTETPGERLIPFVEIYVKRVDQTAGQVIVDWETDY